MKLKLSFVAILIGLSSVYAANVFIRAGATGAATGNNWTDALTNLPSTLVRGNIYYHADGDYLGKTFNTALSGTSEITIKKATPTDHGTDTGWNDTYGDGQASFGAFIFSTGYYTIDGVTGGGPPSWTNNLGFKIRSAGTNLYNFYITFSTGGSNITLKHIEIGTTNYVYPGCDCAGYSASGADNVIFQYCWVYNIGDVGFTILNASNWTWEYSYFDRIDKSGDKLGVCGPAGQINHGAGWEISGTGDTNIVIRYNRISNIEGTGWIGIYANNDVRDLFIYGNTFFNTSDYTNTWGNGIIYNVSGAGGPLYNILIYNNSFINLNSQTVLGLSKDLNGTSPNINSSGNEFKNNIILVNATPVYVGGNTRDYNASNYSLSGDSNLQSLSGSPFTSTNNADFSLSGSTTAGATLIGYSTDLLNTTRGADGVWDRGAYEYIIRRRSINSGTIRSNTTLR